MDQKLTKSTILVSMFLISILSPFANASTTPPSGGGSWTINANETAHVSSQVLIQGDVDVYGTLIIDSYGIYLWGANDWDREIVIHNGGRLEIYNNSILSSYTSTCFGFTIDDGGELRVEGGLIQRACAVTVNTRSEVTLNQAIIEEGRIVLQMPSDVCDQELSLTIDGLTISNQSMKSNPDATSIPDNVALLLWHWQPACSGIYPYGDNLSWSNITITNVCHSCIALGIDENWRSNITINEFTSFNDASLGNYSATDSSSSLPLTWYPLIYSPGVNWASDGNYVRVIAIRNASIYDSGHSLAQTDEDITLLLDNLSTWNMVNPVGEIWAFHGSYGDFFYAETQHRPKWLYDFEGFTGEEGIYGVRFINSETLIINNANISDVWSGIEYWYNSTSSSGGPFYEGLRYQCIILDATHLYGNNVSITDTCNMVVGTDIAQAHQQSSEGATDVYDACGEWSAANTSAYYFDPYFNSGYDGYHDCSEFVGISVLVSQDLSLKDSVIMDNNRNIMHFTYGSSNYWNYRFGVIRSHGILFGDGIGGSGYSDSQMNLESVHLENNTRGGIYSTYLSSSANFIQVNIEVLIDQPSANNQYFWINNSNILTSDCLNQTSYNYWSSGSTYPPRFCRPILLDGPTLVVSSTPYNEFQGDEDIVSGEIIRKWNLEVWVTDPDGQWTPNANVSVWEANSWLVGTQSTGANGGATSFQVKEYSRSQTSRYDYTPHDVEVTMTNYSNSTLVTVTSDMSVIVYDPTPDAFPGDITQDWDTDGDGYGDNISGINPDYFPQDATQWYDTDGDGYGDNYTYIIPQSTGLRIQNGDAFINDASQWSDIDGDGYGDNYTWQIHPHTGLRIENGDAFTTDSTQWSDDDGDGYGDNQSGNNPDWDSSDSTQWIDTDGDGYGDNYTWNWNSSTSLRDDQNGDAFINDSSQWSDIDGDGYGDNSGGNEPDEFPEDYTQYLDEDQDGLGDNQSGNNPDPYLNDSDNDGYNNSVDEFPWNPTQWEDNDNDGLGDNQSGTAADPYLNDTDNDGYNNTVDDFPFDPTQWEDSDGDGYGDNPNGTNPDPSLNDSDNDGVTNDEDDFPWNPTQTTDSDGDGYGDNASGYPADSFPNEPSQWADSDGDGYGDNIFGFEGDRFPYDPTQWSDYDGDGYGDNQFGNAPDTFPFDPSQWSDIDGDGEGDNYTYTVEPTGLRTQNGDAFINDASQWSDIDGDGYGDNLNGSNPDLYPQNHLQHEDSDGDGIGDNYFYNIDQNNGLRVNQIGDAFPDDGTQWSDIDGDGYGDNASGNNADWDPDDPTQWIDADEDGYGDNPLGNNPDPTPGDGDNDGVPDINDAFPNDPNEIFDTDGDGIGDNADQDDDNDGWDDIDEIECQSSPIVFSSFPLDPDNDRICNWLDDDDDNDGLLDSADDCPQQSGTSTFLSQGCPDSDGDSVADIEDTHPGNPYLSIDTDSDGFQDTVDAFPNDPTQWSDYDLDGLGDNQAGNNPDPYLDDSDNDGVINQLDPFPMDPTQWEDVDKDGLGDNPDGENPDPYPGDTDNDGYNNDIDVYRFEPTQWEDSDLDGYGDNQFGEDGDAFPYDATQCCDRDGDGHGDNPNGTDADEFPDDPLQNKDLDGDGLGDNPNGGENSDPYPNDYDNDGVPDDIDVFPEDPTKTLDSDGDGVSVEEEGPLDRIHQRDMPMIVALSMFMLILGVFMGGTMRIRKSSSNSSRKSNVGLLQRFRKVGKNKK